MKVLVINNFNQQEIVDLPAIPRIGDTIPLFFSPAPRVKVVCWLPENVLPELKGSGIDVVINVE